MCAAQYRQYVCALLILKILVFFLSFRDDADMEYMNTIANELKEKVR